MDAGSIPAASTSTRKCNSPIARKGDFFTVRRRSPPSVAVGRSPGEGSQRSPYLTADPPARKQNPRSVTDLFSGTY